MLHVHGAQLLLGREAVHLAVGDGAHEGGLHAWQGTAGEEKVRCGGWEAGGRNQGAETERVAATSRRALRIAAGGRRLAGMQGQTLCKQRTLPAPLAPHRP